jgi:hypothetical protein
MIMIIIIIIISLQTWHKPKFCTVDLIGNHWRHSKYFRDRNASFHGRYKTLWISTRSGITLSQSLNIDNNNTLITDAIQKDITGHSFNLNLSQIYSRSFFERKQSGGRKKNFFFCQTRNLMCKMNYVLLATKHIRTMYQGGAHTENRTK